MNRIHRTKQGSRRRSRDLTARWLLAAALGVGVAGSGDATALTLNVDVGNGPLYVGTADAPDSGTTWNLYGTPGVAVPLVDSQGNATTAVFQTGAEPLPPNISGAAIVTYDSGATNDMLRDELALSATSNSVAWQVSGLAPNTLYDFYAYGSLAVDVSFFIESEANAGPLGSLRIRALSDGTGVISGEFCGPCTFVYTAGLSGLQIQSLPEPGLSLLMAPAIAACLRRRTGQRR